VNKILLILLINTQIQAQIFLGNSGNISFFSETPLENITAINDNVSAVFDASNNDLVFKLSISDFIFPNALMQEHFNENYLESDKYPNSTFSGTVTNLYNDNATVEGKLTIHGITNKITANGSFVNNGDFISIVAYLSVRLDDYNIKIPTILMYKIAENIKVNIDIKLKSNK
jgi:hypothetical protein